jgi:dienelactone hydrolase
MAWLTKGTSGSNPHTFKEVDVIVAKAIDFLHSKGYKDIAAVGYCFGAKYVTRFMGPEKGSPVKVGYVAHPSFVDEDELAAIKGPYSISAAETDEIFPKDKRVKSEEILKNTGLPYQINLFQGVVHGFAVRGDLDNKWQLWTKERAFNQAVEWINYHL